MLVGEKQSEFQVVKECNSEKVTPSPISWWEMVVAESG